METSELHLQKMRYPNNDFDSCFITAQEVAEVLAVGKIPHITLPQSSNGPTVAVLMAVEKHPDREEPDYYVPEFYVEAITQNGGNPVFIGFDKTAEQLQQTKPQAILLVGGDFAFPPAWLEEGIQAHGGNLRREKAYETMITYAKEHKLPLLGICAGEQVLAGTLGAKLCMVKGHRASLDDDAHLINIVPHTLLAKLCGLKMAKVNSNHHMAVSAKTSGDFVVSATAEDGTIEAIEPKDPWHYFVLGVQWHPERMVKKEDFLTDRIFNGFMKAARGGFVHNHEAIPFSQAPMVEIDDPHFIVDMMYAKPQNLSGQPVYELCGIGNHAYVRIELWEALKKLIPWLEEHRLKLKICDAFRPMSAHMALKEAIHEKGPGIFASLAQTSKHCHGTAVDILLTDMNGNELAYPTKVDCYRPDLAAKIQKGDTKDFYEYTKCGRHDYFAPNLEKEIANREQLKNLMESVGLISWVGEWWHYELPDEFNLVYPPVERRPGKRLEA